MENLENLDISRTLFLNPDCAAFVLAHPGAISRLASFNVHSTVERINTVEIPPPPTVPIQMNHRSSYIVSVYPAIE